MKAQYHKKTGQFLGNTSEPIETDLIGITDTLCKEDFFKTFYDVKNDLYYEGGTEEEIQKYQEKKDKEKKQFQFDELSKTDWYVVRFMETGVPIPEEIINERNNIRNL